MKVLAFIRKMVGASAGADGRSGYVPKPLAGQHGYALFGDGTYKNIPGGGDMLAANDLAEINTAPKRAAARVNLDVPSNSEELARRWSMSGHVKFDGTSAGQQGLTYLPGFNPGVGSISVAVDARIPTIAPTASNGAGLFGIGGSGSFNASGGFALIITTAGHLEFQFCGNGGSSGLLIKRFSNFVTAYGGKKMRITFVRAAGGTVTIFFDKLDVTASFSDATNGSGYPASWAETMSGQFVGIGRAYSTGIYTDHISSLEIFNLALSATEVAEIVDHGVLSKFRWAAPGAHFGHNQIAQQERNSLFTVSSDSKDWAAYGGGSSVVDTTADELDVTVPAGQDGVYLPAANLTQLKAGQLHRLSFTIRNMTTLTGVIAYWGQDHSSGIAIGTATADGNWWFEFTPTSGVDKLILIGNAAGSFSVTDIFLTPSLLLNGSFETPGSNGGKSSGVVSATRARASNVATITTGLAHGLVTGNVITTTLFGAAAYNAVGVAVTRIDDTTFTYANTGADEGATADTAGRIATDVFAGWIETVDATGSSTVNRDTSVTHSGGSSIRLDIDAAGKYAAVNQLPFRTGLRHRLTMRVRHNKGSTLGVVQLNIGGSSDLQITSDDNGAISIPDLTWTRIQYTFTAVGTNFTLIRPSSGGLASKSLWFDDIVIEPLGCPLSLSPWGLDRSTVWKNQALSEVSGDATISGIVLDAATGAYLPIVLGPGRGFGGERQDIRTSRERRGLMGGGISLDGNAAQRITCSPSTAQSVGTDPVWLQFSISIPTANPAATRWIAIITSSSSGASAANAFGILLDSSGQILVRLFGSSASHYRQATVPNVVSNYGGKVITGAVCRTAGGLLIGINGDPVVFVEAVNGTPPPWTGSITGTFFHAGDMIADLLLLRIGRGALTPALLAELTTTGLSSSSGSPISRNGSFSAAANGAIIDWFLAAGFGHTFKNLATHSSMVGSDGVGNWSAGNYKHIAPKDECRFRARRTATGFLSLNTGAGQKITPDYLSAEGDTYVIAEAWLKTSADITAVQLGENAGAAATLVASVAVTAAGGWTPLTLLKRQMASPYDIHLTFTGSATVDVEVLFKRRG